MNFRSFWTTPRISVMNIAESVNTGSKNVICGNRPIAEGRFQHGNAAGSQRLEFCSET
jgi:protein tyrosine phosphatase (PTP) superfamily phosphohydrolase (DUF442 family)